MMDSPSPIVLVGGKVIDRTGRHRADVRISRGKIVAVGDDVGVVGSTVLDCDGCLITPGLVDMQVHFREPQRPGDCVDRTLRDRVVPELSVGSTRIILA